jgi:hypothetical protein
MPHSNIPDNAIPLRMYIKATADLECSARKDLEVEDPDENTAKAILSGEANESTEGNDGEASSSDDTESCSQDSA